MVCPRTYADGERPGVYLCTAVGRSVKNHARARDFLLNFRRVKQKLGGHDRIESALFRSLLVLLYQETSPICNTTTINHFSKFLPPTRLGDTGAGVYFQKQCPSGGKTLFISKARLGGEETGPHSALFIYLIHFVGGTTGLADASGYRPMGFFGS